MVGRWPRVPAASSRLHVALVAPPWYPVPPYGYGGIELMVGLLADQLRALGHRVTLFAAKGSARAEVCAPPGLHVHLGLPAAGLHEAIYLARVLATLQELSDVDVVHDHSSYGGLLCVTRTHPGPVVHTVHGPLDPGPRSFYRELGSAAGLVAISVAQHSAAPELNWSGSCTTRSTSPVSTPTSEDPAAVTRTFSVWPVSTSRRGSIWPSRWRGGWECAW